VGERKGDGYILGRSEVIHLGARKVGSKVLDLVTAHLYTLVKLREVTQLLEALGYSSPESQARSLTTQES